MKTRMSMLPNKQTPGSIQVHARLALNVNRTKRLLVGLVLAVAVMAPYGILYAAGPAPVNLGTTSNFTLLAGSAITTGGGTIQGDVGLSPTTGAAITGLTAAQVAGIIYAVDAAGPVGSVVDTNLLTVAKGDLTTAYNDARDRTDPDAVDPGAGDIGGMSLVPGLYKFTSSAAITGADLTLTGGVNDVWIFQMGTTLTVGSGIDVVLAGGAQAQNVFWQVGSSATIGTFAVFRGTMMADQSITMNASSILVGRALAMVAAVTFSGSSASRPTRVVLYDFYLREENGQVMVCWQTASEDQTLGFDLFRDMNGSWVKVNDNMIAAQGWPNGGIGAAYGVADAGANAQDTFRYKLVEYETDGGIQEYGPYDRAVWTPRVGPVAVTRMGVEIHWLSRAGETYDVMRTLDLRSAFLPIATDLIATPPANTYTDPLNEAPAAYYRIKAR